MVDSFAKIAADTMSKNESKGSIHFVEEDNFNSLIFTFGL